MRPEGRRGSLESKRERLRRRVGEGKKAVGVGRKARGEGKGSLWEVLGRLRERTREIYFLWDEMFLSLFCLAMFNILLSFVLLLILN